MEQPPIMSTSSISSTSRGQLLGQCVPISCIKLVDGSLLIIAEGPCLLLTHPKKNFDIRRFQLFPNQCTITGFCFVEESCGYPCRTKAWNGPSSDHSLVVVWAGNCALLVTIHRPSFSISTDETYPHNCHSVINLDYIPIAAKWFNEGQILSLLAVHNYVVIYERQDTSAKNNLKQLHKWECSERENLYSGTMQGEELSQLIVFSGTTFKGILVWTVKDGKANIIHRLIGHKGIPFSLDFQSNLLLSASDDRMVIIWEFKNKEGSLSSICEQGVNISQILRGHESRVWKAIWVNLKGFLFVVSVGEDSCVRSISYDQSATKSWKAHDGAPVYACAYDPLYDLLYTSAHDGAVHKWKRFYLQNSPSHISYDKVEAHPFTEHLIKLNAFGRSAANKDYPRNVCTWGTDYLLAKMDSGRVIAYNFPNKVQSNIFLHSSLKRYGVLSVSRQNAMLAIGGLRGEFFMLKTTIKEHIDEDMPCRFYAENVWSRKFPLKIINIHWLADDERNLCLIVTLNIAFLYRFFYEEDNNEKAKLVGQCLQTFQLQLERPGLPCALLAKQQRYLLLGDELGHISLYPVNVSTESNESFSHTHSIVSESKEDAIFTIPDTEVNEVPSETNREKCSCFKVNLTSCGFQTHKIHKEGVTSIVEYKSRIMSAGRYGGIRTYELEDQEGKLKLIQIQEFSPPFEWVAKLAPIPDKTDMLVCGFLKGSFIIYSWEQKRVLNEIYNLGGGHRRWDFRYEFGIAALTFLRDRELYFSSTTIQDSLDVILKPGLHSRTINCGVLLERNEQFQYLATGSEDGSIRVLKYDTTNHKFNPLHRISNHASSVRVLISVPIDQNHVLLFSGGGRSEVYATLIGLGSSSEELCTVGKIVLIRTKNRETDIDTRVMDLSVVLLDQNFYCACACSDGLVRILFYSLASRKFKLLRVLQGGNNCIMRVQLLQEGQTILVFGVASNGYLLVWNLPTKVFCDDQSVLVVIPPSFSYRVRNCAVMSMKVWKNLRGQSQEFSIVIGGDDCSISFWNLQFNEKLEKILRVDLLWSSDQIQRGALTELYIHCDHSSNKNNMTIFSCSNDQVIAHWDLKGNLLGSAFAGVSDCQGFVVCVEDDLITCFGDGVSWISCP